MLASGLRELCNSYVMFRLLNARRKHNGLIRQARVDATDRTFPGNVSYDSGDNLGFAIVCAVASSDWHRAGWLFIRQTMNLKCIPLIFLACLTLNCGKASQAWTEKPKPETAGSNVSVKTVDGDSDEDGIPDAAELHSFDDRANFRRWFTSIAEMQFYELSDAWSKEQRDCAGLVRFAWREALRRHDRIWFQGMGAKSGAYEAVAPDVKAYSLEKSPLGEKLFRTEFGAFEKDDLANGKFSEFADARTLKNYNVTFLTRDRQPGEKPGLPQPGDLLFFHQPQAHKFPYHVMIFLGAARVAGEGANDWVVYHTGSSPEDKGEVKKVRLSVLDQHPNVHWRPIQSNQNFLGFYRLKILQ